METKSVNALAYKLYSDIEQNGIEGMKDLFFEGETEIQSLKYDKDKEYVKRMIMAQLNMGKMLLCHKYANMGFNGQLEFNTEVRHIRQQIKTGKQLQFNKEELNFLFGNSLEISSVEEHEEWQYFVNHDRHNGKKFESIFFEEEFKYNYENETNLFKKFIKSFRYKKMLKNNMLEDSYVKKVREMIRKRIIENPENTFVSYVQTHGALEKGVVEYEEIKEVEDIARMALISLTTEPDKLIDIERVCMALRKEMKNTTSSTRIGTEYRQKQVTLGSKTGIHKRPIIETVTFTDVPEKIRRLQAEYETAYNLEQSQEDFIKQVTKIFADFIYIQPYEDGNKRTALCLFNSMLLSKGIIPPPISLINDEQMVEAFYKVHNDKDYKLLQDIVVGKYKSLFGNNQENYEGENSIDQGDKEALNPKQERGDFKT